MAIACFLQLELSKSKRSDPGLSTELASASWCSYIMSQVATDPCAVMAQFLTLAATFDV